MQRASAGRTALAGAADAGRAAARERRHRLDRHRGPADDRPARSRPSGDAGAAARRRPAARRAFGQRERLDQPDPRRACAEKPRRADSADHRRRSDRARARIDDRRGDRRTAAAAAPGSDRRSTPKLRRADRIEAPGQLASHYAPSKPLRLECATKRGADEYLIGFGAIDGDANLSASGDLVEAAARLFDLLHQADASAKPRIAVAPVPDEGLGAAINDRLRRARQR